MMVGAYNQRGPVSYLGLAAGLRSSLSPMRKLLAGLAVALLHPVRSWQSRRMVCGAEESGGRATSYLLCVCGSSCSHHTGLGAIARWPVQQTTL